jgi:1-acyl-sn-glycerol-3-phosphate acyltransferase
MHRMTIESSPPAGREPLLTGITTFLAEQDAATLDDIRQSLSRELDEAGPRAVDALCDRLARTGTDWHYYARDPLARRIHEILAERLLGPDMTRVDLPDLDDLAGRPVVMVANHLSYSDANVLEVLLRRAGAGSLCDRLTVIAGPKVYSTIRRRFSSLCFGTVKVPQTSARATEEAVMPTREIARAARLAIETALHRLSLGEALLVFAEGTRSRSGEMQRLLPGAARYLDYPGTVVLPVALTGTEDLFPVGERTFRPAPIAARFGRPISADALRARSRRERRLMVDTLGVAIADLLPSAYRGTYRRDAPELLQAVAILDNLTERHRRA